MIRTKPTILLLCTLPLLGLGQTEEDAIAHFICAWPAADSLLEWDILRADFSADCAHFMSEAQTSAPHENCNHLVAYRNANFMHVAVENHGVYVFIGSEKESGHVKYDGIVRVGEDALENWQGANAIDDLPILSLNWLHTSHLLHSLCD